MKTKLPKIIEDVGFDFHWDESKVWKLDAPSEEIPIEELSWHFDIPFWSTSTGYYDLSPAEVLNRPELYKDHTKRVEKADLSHPLDIMFWKNRWLLLDGLHRLAKMKKLGYEKVKVRKIPKSAVNLIKY